MGDKTKQRRKVKTLKVTKAQKPERQRECSEIALRDFDEPKGRNPEKQIEWIFQCLGFGDKDDTVAKEVFTELVKKSDKGVRSVEISGRCHVTQGAVVYHLNTLVRSGVVVKQGRYYYLKRTRLDNTIEDMEAEMLRRFERMKRIARLIEEEM
ncbi:Uncharacterised protein [uncultured archaeon]|nr:Uncharacterised protein [uncultured archaeon]